MNKSIPLLKKMDIIEIEVNSTFDSIDDYLIEKTNKENILINIDLGRWTSEVNKNEALVETYNFYDDIINQAVRGITDIDFESHTLNGIFSFNLIDGISKESQINNMFNKVNENIKDLIDEELGVNLQKFIDNKQSEQHEEMLCEYENIIRKKFHYIVRSKISAFDLSIIYHLDSTPKNFDLKENVFEETSNVSFKIRLPKKLNYRDFKSLDVEYDKINQSILVEDFVFIQKNNPTFIKINANSFAKKLINDCAMEATNEFYNNPIYKTDKLNLKSNLVFLGRVNDGKGKGGDAWGCVKEGSKSIKIVTDNNTLGVMDNGINGSLEDFKLFKNADEIIQKSDIKRPNKLK
jgi:hypothetical protein